MNVTAQSLILDLASATERHEIPVRLLVPVAQLFGITDNNIRVALARLKARGLLDAGQRGRYRLAKGAWPVQRHVASWTGMEDRTAAWTGGWVSVFLSAAVRSRSRSDRRRLRALSFMGFRELESRLFIRPDNLTGGFENQREHLLALGLDPDSRVFAISEMDPATATTARNLWDTSALDRTYRSLRETLRKSARQVNNMTLEQALVETFTQGGRVLHDLAFDPLLPEEIHSPTNRRELVEEMRQYDEIGRRHWDLFARQHGVNQLVLPLSCAFEDEYQPPQSRADVQGGKK